MPLIHLTVDVSEEAIALLRDLPLSIDSMDRAYALEQTDALCKSGLMFLILDGSNQYKQTDLGRLVLAAHDRPDTPTQGGSE